MARKPPPDPRARRPDRQRRSADLWSGALTTEGDPDLAATLGRALVRRGEHERATQSFHSYPARLHPAAASDVLRALLPPRKGRPGVVIDPFCGGGTVLVEAMLAGATAHGRDLNPVAVMVARARTRLLDDPARQALRATAHALVVEATARGRARQPPRLPDAVWAMRDWYARQPLLELGTLLELVEQTSDSLRPLLRAVHSSLVVKFSLRAAETSSRKVSATPPPGAACRLFRRRAHTLADGLEALWRRRPPRVADVRPGDARRIEAPPADLILTSPPYPATYDYLDMQRLRLAWLGAPTPPDDAELGSRADFHRDPDHAWLRWRDDTAAWMRAAADRLRPGAHLAIVIGDGRHHHRLLDAAGPTLNAARDLGLRLRARASVERRDHAADTTKLEHLIALQRPPHT